MLSENLDYIKSQIPEGVTLVAVSKTKPHELIIEAYDAGQRVFGENRVQELIEKQDALPKDIEWHMIGHLQTKKVKSIASFVTLIHAVDTPKLLVEIDKQGKKNDRKINCLLQFHIAEEETKYGFSAEEVKALLQSEEVKQLENVQIAGVMGMASFTSDQRQVREEFKVLKTIFNDLKSSFFSTDDEFKIISMGMSGDYEIAISEGSNMVRVGSSIFGAR